MLIKKMQQGVMWIFLFTPLSIIAHFPEAMHTKSIEQHAAHLYFTKPHLQHYLVHHKQEQVSTISLKKRIKKIGTFLSEYGLDIGMFSYCFYKIYGKHQEIYDTDYKTQPSGIKATLLSYVPTTFINAPKHTTFFLDSMEIIIKAYLLKTILKLLIFLCT